MQQLKATNVHTVERIDNMSREMCQLTERMSTLEMMFSSGFAEIKSILQQGESSSPAQPYGQQAIATFSPQMFPVHPNQWTGQLH